MRRIASQTGSRLVIPRRVVAGTAVGLLTLPSLILLSIARAEDFDSSRLYGTVTDASGNPVAGAAVWVNNVWSDRAEDLELAPGSQLKTTTDKDGNYELRLRYSKAKKTLSVGEVDVELRGYVCAGRREKIPLHAGNSTKLDFRLEKGEILTGTMRLPLMPWDRGAPAEAIAEKSKRVFEVVGNKLDGLPLNVRCHLTDANGNFEVFVPPGEYTLRVLFYDGEPLEWSGIKSGQKNLVLEVPAFEWSEANVGKVFDDLWNVMDQNYSHFFLKKDVDWSALRDKYRPTAIKAKNSAELVAVLKEMLSHLGDLHVWIETPAGIVPTFQGGGYVYNGNRDVTLSQLEDRVECGKFGVVGKTKQDGFGYFLMLRQSAATKADVKAAVEAVQRLRTAPAFVVDLRTANGGSEPLALEIARLFCDKDAVYAKSKYRNGPEHDHFGQDFDRVLPRSLDAYTRPVVCLVGPGAVSSGEGFVKMMKCLPHVSTVGMPTRGASGNPKPWPLSRTRLTVYYSSWVDMLPNGEVYEGVGIAPDTRVDLPKDAYLTADPTLEKGFEILRAKLASGNLQKNNASRP
jgi:hypothetical protein